MRAIATHRAWQSLGTAKSSFSALLGAIAIAGDSPVDIEELRRNIEWAKENHERLVRDRDAELARWEPKLKASREVLSRYEKDLILAEGRIRDELSQWVEHDGGLMPVSADTMIIYRSKSEWSVMKAGRKPALTEPAGGCEADCVDWTWSGDELQDVAAYRVVPTSAGEAGTADTPQSESVHEHATSEAGDAQPLATPPSSGTQS